jgi:hypothetical protein
MFFNKFIYPAMRMTLGSSVLSLGQIQRDLTVSGCQKLAVTGTVEQSAVSETVEQMVVTLTVEQFAATETVEQLAVKFVEYFVGTVVDRMYMRTVEQLAVRAVEQLAVTPVEQSAATEIRTGLIVFRTNRLNQPGTRPRTAAGQVPGYNKNPVSPDENPSRKFERMVKMGNLKSGKRKRLVKG